jgi:hypothetical protein
VLVRVWEILLSPEVLLADAPGILAFGLGIVQVYVVPAGTISPPTTFVGVIVKDAPEQIVSLLVLITGVGLTVMVKVSTGPEHETEPLVNVGVTVIVAKIGSLVLFVAVKLGIPIALPTLAAANPILGLLFIQV